MLLGVILAFCKTAKACAAEGQTAVVLLLSVHTRLHILAPSGPKLPLVQRKPLIPQSLRVSLYEFNPNKSSQSLENLLTIKGLRVAERGLGLVFTWLRRDNTRSPRIIFIAHHEAWCLAHSRLQHFICLRVVICLAMASPAYQVGWEVATSPPALEGVAKGLPLPSSG